MLEFDKFLEGCQRGDRDSYKEFYTKYYGVVYNSAVRHTHQFSDAEDLMQDIFIKSFDKISLFHGDSYQMLGGWLKRLAINYCIDHNRKVTLDITDGVEVTFIEDNTERYIEYEYELDEMLSAIERLSPRYQEVFNMYVLDGYSHDTICKRLGINQGTSKSNLFKAKQNLRKYLKDGKSRSV